MVGNTLEKQSLPDYRIMDQIMNLSLKLTWVIDILLEKLTLKIEDWIWKTHSVCYACGVGDFMQNLSSFLKKISVVGQSHGEVS